MKHNIKVAICGNLPTAYNFLLQNGVVKIDKYMDATEIQNVSFYHLILVYAPQAEGLLNTQYSSNDFFEEGIHSIPIRLLNEPCCKSALVELESTIRRISSKLSAMNDKCIPMKGMVYTGRFGTGDTCHTTEK